ncbi:MULTISPECIES: IclR family transcriptional regulator [Streptomyces]|uniref:IclR family transcriptional regulator n=1 Tax=Streptomyces TaxID=1883 RepID=UPI00292CB74E|nr:IclR family transcriptional regulator [Streptomyces sp. NEAU-HV9]
MSSPPEAGRSGIQVIRRAARILDAVGAHNGAMRLADLDDEVQLAKTTTHRIVSALAEERLLRIDPDGRVWLGSALCALAGTAASGLVEQLRPVLVELQRQVDETVDLSVLESDAVRFVDQVQSTQVLRVVSAVGAAFPLHCTANGKAFLAALPRETVDRLLARAMERFTPTTVTSKADLLEELARIRTTGVAFDREEHTVGIAAVGAVVTRDGAPVAAISIPVPAERFAAREAQLVRHLRTACESAST